MNSREYVLYLSFMHIIILMSQTLHIFFLQYSFEYFNLFRWAEEPDYMEKLRISVSVETPSLYKYIVENGNGCLGNHRVFFPYMPPKYVQWKLMIFKFKGSICLLFR
jgi:hypothetical protein